MCAHGTADEQGAQVVPALTELIRRRLHSTSPERQQPAGVVAAYLQEQAPLLGDALAELTGAGTSAIVVPLLLATGFHNEVDIPSALATAGEGVPIAASRPVGPHPALARLLDTRLRAAGVPPDAAVVLGVTGSSRASGAADAQRLRDWLAARRAGPVTLGYAAARPPSVEQAVAEARQTPGPSGPPRAVAVAAYLLGPGQFLTRWQQAGADWVSAPLGADPVLADLVVDRYRETLAAGLPSRA